MKKKILLVLVLTIVLRIITVVSVKADPLFFLFPRNFNGRGLLALPSWIDFIIPLLVLVILFNRNVKFKFNYRNLVHPFVSAVILILTPILTGIMLNNYVQKSLVTFEINPVLVLRYILFILTFLSINYFADTLSVSIRKKAFRFSILFIFLISIAYTQDIFGSANSMDIVLGFVNSVGVSTVIFSIGMRKDYKANPFESIAAISIIGIVLIFFVYNVLSVSFFTIFLPFIAFFVIALILFSNWKIKTKIIVGSLPFVIALFLNYGLPRLVSPELANELIENKPEETFFVEKAGNITVKYKDKSLKDISFKFAKVIDAANQICNEKFGISPNVKELVISGIAPGGFHAEFPDRIVGNIISEKYLENCSDSSFLNNPGLSANFPDPVNAILHEYSHLFGVIPYHKWWPGAEEEGWATYSATVISELLSSQEKYAGIWQSAYNYGKQAEKITKQNLSEKAVVWSHPNEYGGFILWYNLEKVYGLKELYQKRWENSRHDLKGSLYIESNPKAAMKVVNVFGKENFLKYGELHEKVFEDIYPINDYLYLARTTGIDEKRIKKMYEFMKTRKINPAIPIP